MLIAKKTFSVNSDAGIYTLLIESQVSYRELSPLSRLWPKPGEPLHQQVVWKCGEYHVWGGWGGGAM